MRWILIAIVAVAGIYIGYRAYAGSTGVEMSYITAPVERARLQESVTSSGTLNAVVTVEVSSQVSGQIAALHADFNDSVIEDEPLAVINRKSFQARLAKAEASLEMAKANVSIKQAERARALEEYRKAEANRAILEARRDKARARYSAANSDLERKETLSARGAVSASDLDTSSAEQKQAAAALRESKASLATYESDLAAAKADITRAEAELENARANAQEKEATVSLAKVELERTTIRSPIDGVVINRNVDQGQTVAASLEAPTLFTIAQDLSDMEVHAKIDETDIGKIQVGQTAAFQVDAYPNRRFTGEVVQIRKAPEVIQNVVTYTVVIRTSNEDLLLLPGMTALVKIVVMRGEEVLLVPTAALDYAPGGQARSIPSSGTAETGAADAIVWRLADGNLESVPVKTGQSDARNTEILGGGLSESDQVIVNELAEQSGDGLFGIRLGF